VKVRPWPIALALLVGLVLPAMALPAQARANAYTRLESYYVAHNTIPPCRFPSRTLQTALGEASTYADEYFLDLNDAIGAALRAQAAVRCVHGHVASGSLTSSRYPPPPRSLTLPRAVTAPGNGGVPAPLALLAVLAALGLAGAGAATLWRARGLDPHWLASWRQACAEAGWRLTDAAASLRDRLPH
jgi:hypothetical protein